MLFRSSGQSAEAIAQAFPVLNLELVYGAITYYLAHRDDIDRYLRSRQHDFDSARQAARDADPMFFRFQADADLNQVIVSAVVRSVPAIDFRTATTAGLAGLKDQDVLASLHVTAASWSPTTRRRCLDTSASSCGHSGAPT